jgi:polyhydroxyalkanoate synthase subunit PhaC
MTTVDDMAAPLDALLIDAAIGPVRHLLPDLSTARLAVRLTADARGTVRRVRRLGEELNRVAKGESEVRPHPRDRRFADPGWDRNPVARRMMQAYLATGEAVGDLIAGAGLGWRDDQRARFLAGGVLEALSPSNLPLVHPGVLKAAIDSGGLTLARGAARLVRDLATPPRIPQMSDPAGFAVGGTVAATPGAVVLRTEVLELIQYAPQTPAVRRVPLLLVPPAINKFYVLDLAPGRSLIEHLVRDGQQVFVLSWRNPDARHAGWGLDVYLRSILDALAAVERICRTDRTILAGACSGGILAAVAAAHLAATGAQERLAGLALLVTVLDHRRAGLPAALADRYLARAATTMSRRRGYLDGRRLAEVFAWLRPGDLIWPYWVDNYLLDRPSPVFDILFWNADTTRMTAALHADFVDLAMQDRLAVPGATTVLGTPIDLAAVTVDAYAVAGLTDHLTPWQSCYRTTQMLGGATRFVLSTSGHIAAIVNPPGTAKAGYRVAHRSPELATDWYASAENREGSWWPDFTQWLRSHSGPARTARKRLGGNGFTPQVEAPGTYVFDS